MKVKLLVLILTLFFINTITSQTANPVNDMEVCDDDTDGDDTNGFQNFNLDIQTPAILGSQSATDFTVTYHQSLSDAASNINALFSPYTNTTANSQTIYARVTDNNTNSFDTTSFDLVVNPLPIITSVVELRQCDDDTDGFTAFNLNEANSDISTNFTNEDFQFYLSLTDAQNGTNAIANTSSFTNTTVTTDTVWARIINSLTGCFRIAQINLTVSTTGIPVSFQRSFTQCDDFLDINGNDNANNDDTDGVSTFDFSSVTQDIINLFPATQQLIVTYYRNQTDALAETNEITDLSNYRNIGYPNTQQIYIRVDSNLDNDCLGFGPFITLTVDPVPVANSVANISLCDNDDDGIFDNGIVQTFNLDQQTPLILGTQSASDYTVTYHTSATDALDGFNTITTTDVYENITANQQTIYVRVTNNTTGCFTNHTSFDLIVNPLPDFTVTSPQIVCLNGSPLTLTTENPASVYDYIWTDPFGNMTTGFEIIITSGGLYTVTATTTNGTGCSRTRTIQVNQSGIATISLDDLTIVEGTTNSMTIDPTNIGIGFYEYALTDESNNIIRAYQNSTFFDNLQPGIYNLLVRDKNGCGMVSIPFTINDASASLDDYYQIDFSLVENPLYNSLLIQFSDTSITEVDILIYNLNGKSIYRSKATLSESKTSIDISSITSGIYIIKISSQEKVSAKKFLIKKS